MSYFERLGEIRGALLDFKTTDREGKSLSQNDGLIAAASLIREAPRSYFIGNGGSAAIASHQALDAWRTAGVKAMTFNDPSLITCLGNDLGFDKLFAAAIRSFGSAGDLLVVISSSGASPNILAGATAARELEMKVLTLSGFAEDNPLRSMGDINLWVPRQDYGPVEVSHLAILHSVVDVLAKERTAKT